ncbi:septum site-determining protein MinC [Virgibacillus phasianinus]|uniref:Probable septum site-determining protein MinC n=1 Tax=Virgibacillus phasianinus TaxID=2017483 RepID=A0A220U4I0_9BACI|nr:septum site-determining protein MinC [Virgibacillus phasianinus]ASK63068.1 septum site-determining protein MinC [Virgibacillus phasianinus]
MPGKKQLITIKGTRDGLTLFIDDSCSYDEAYNDLSEKLSTNRPQKDEPVVSVNVQLGSRYLDQMQTDELKELINNGNHFMVESIHSDVVSKKDAIQWMEESEVKMVNQIVRSGQVVEVKGDLLLIGDVNPGGKVEATGNIYVMGSLLGTAHAGINGNSQAIIVASFMKPSQLRIADYISRAPDYESDGVYMECGQIDEKQDKIVIDRLQVLSRKQIDLNGFERRMNNG